MVAEETPPPAARDPFDALDAIDDAQWDRLGRATILFAHHSVGRNILDGVAALLAERPHVTLPIVRVEPGEAPGGAGLFHFSPGANGDPAAKLAGFAEVMGTPLGARADIALCKLCYADIGPGVVAQPVFETYRDTLAALRSRHPDTLFVHPTIPLRTPRGTRARLKNLLLRSFGRASHPDPNLARNRYNALLREEYTGRAPIFDIALEESTRADGTRAVDPRFARSVEVMAREWTDDGGHLGERGRRRLGAALLALLARHAP